ncbi:unnamed protein product [Discosporangium mesarthrocarpum]
MEGKPRWALHLILIGILSIFVGAESLCVNIMGGKSVKSTKSHQRPQHVYGVDATEIGVQNAVVTGANRGLGFAIAERMLELGHRVVLACRDEEEGRTAVSILRARGHGERALFHQLDVSREESVRDFGRKCVQVVLEGRVDALFNNAGVCLAGGSPEVMEATLAVNFIGALRMMEECLRCMCRAGKGSIVWISSGDGELCYLSSFAQDLLRGATSAEVHPLFDVISAVQQISAREGTSSAGYDTIAFSPTPAYSLSKAAANAVIRTEAPSLLSSWGVSLTAVCPGDVRTRMCSVLPQEEAAGVEVITPAQAAQAVVQVGLRPSDFPPGQFYRDGRRIEW